MLSLFTILSSLQTELHPWLPHDLRGHTPSTPAEGRDDGYSQDGSWTLTSKLFWLKCQLLNIPLKWFGPDSFLRHYLPKEMMALWKNDGIKWSQIRSHLSQPWKQSQPCDASICHPRLYLSRSMQGLISVLFFHWHRTTKLCIEYNFRFRQFFRMLCIETFFVRCCSDVEMCQYITAIVVKNFILCYSLQIYNLFRLFLFLHLSFIN